MREKIALFCNVPKENVLQNLDAKSLYEVPLMLEKENLAKAVCKALRLPCPEPDLVQWEQMVEAFHHPLHTVTIALVGKYVALHDAYLSVVEALKHGGIENRASVEIKWIDSEELTKENIDSYLGGVDGILVPGGFGKRGTEGMILAADYARGKQIPYLGICLGMQIALISFARSVCGFSDANSTELDSTTTHPVIDLLPDQNGVENIGGTLRLGAYPCRLAEGSLAHSLYGNIDISERHRHRYEVNNEYRDVLQEKGLTLSGLSPDGHIVEMLEISDHPYYIATQAHPEFKSRPDAAHPLFKGLIGAALEYKKEK